jgi:hypothetical protein
MPIGFGGHGAKRAFAHQTDPFLGNSRLERFAITWNREALQISLLTHFSYA